MAGCKGARFGNRAGSWGMELGSGGSTQWATVIWTNFEIATSQRVTLFWIDKRLPSLGVCLNKKSVLKNLKNGLLGGQNF